VSGGSRAILGGGLLAGILDIAAAFVFYGLRGVPPIRILHSIASGLLGPAASKGGLATAVLGLLLHFVIALGWALVYYVVSRRLPVLSRRAILSGMAYGVAVYFLMNLVVLPLSAIPKRPFAIDPVMVVIHMACVGLPIALAVRRWAPKI
jgi:hypothetical protein